MESVGILRVRKMNASHPEKRKQEKNNSVFNFLLSLWAGQQDRLFLPIWHYIHWAKEMIFKKITMNLITLRLTLFSQTLCLLINFNVLACGGECWNWWPVPMYKKKTQKEKKNADQNKFLAALRYLRLCLMPFQSW